MSLKLWGLFRTPAFVHTSYFDCFKNATAGKVKLANIVHDVVIWAKIQAKNYCKLQLL